MNCHQNRIALMVSVAGLLVAACSGGDSVTDPGATTLPPAASSQPGGTDETLAPTTAPANTLPDSTVALDTAPGTEETPDWPSSPVEIYDVVVTEDIVYGQGEVDGGGSFVDLRLDLYAPQDTGQTTLPLVVVVHGGGFTGGSKAQGNVVDWAQGFAARGYLVASIDYRLMGIARPDTGDTMTTLVEGSAGAITVNYVAYALDDFGIERPPVAALVSNWGGLPFGGTATTFVDNPVPSLEAPYAEPPVYLAHATGDPAVPYSLSTDIAAKASAVGLDHKLYTKDVNAHAFDLTSNLVTPGVSVLDDQVTWVTCRLYPHLADAPECA